MCKPSGDPWTFRNGSGLGIDMLSPTLRTHSVDYGEEQYNARMANPWNQRRILPSSGSRYNRRKQPIEPPTSFSNTSTYSNTASHLDTLAQSNTMRFFTFLPALFCLGVQALPAAQTEKQTPDVDLPTAPVETSPLSTEILAAPTDLPIKHFEKRDQISATIEKELHKLGLSLDSTVKSLFQKLGLKALHHDLGRLLNGLVGEAEGVEGKVDDIVTDLLHDLGMEDGLDETICDVEKVLGVKHTDTLRKLMRSLHLL